MNLKFEEEKKKERRIQILKEAIRFMIELAVVVMIAWIIVHFALKKVSVIGSTMENTLYNGEDVIVNKSAYMLLSPGREALIAFYPEEKEGEETVQDDSTIFVRRIVGLPGEKIQIKDGSVYIDGERLEEKYNYEKMVSAGIANDEITLGDDEYFVLSDNRADMDDSRNTTFTKVKKSNIIGKVIIKLNPLSLIGGPELETTEETKQ